MGSDSRSATATKPRPKWRDRHLSQLNNDQLEEVQVYRGDDSVAQLAGVESQTDSYPETDIDATQKLPQRQAGPDRVNRSKADDRRRQHSYRDSQETDGQRESERQPETHRRDDTAREKLRDFDRREASANRQSDPARQHRRDPHFDHHSAAARRPEASHKQDNHKQDRYREETDRVSQQESRDRPRTDRYAHEPRRYLEDPAISNRDVAANKRVTGDRDYGSRAAEVGVEDPNASATKTGAFARLLSFKVQGPVKYGLIALAMVLLVVVSIMKPIDNSSQSQLDNALTRAMIGFGLARTLNGVISVAQGTEFAVQPAGVGVNFSPGEILDPINDLVERFSWVMLLATSSLGVQKILLEVSSWAGITMLLAGAGLFFLLTRIRNSAVSSMADVAGKVLLLMLLVRFLIPLGTLANDWVYKQFLQPKFEESSQQLEIASVRIREISSRQTYDENAGGTLKQRAKNLYDSMTSKFDFDGMLNDYKNSAENVSEHAVNLIVVFLLQTIVFPILFLYLIYRLFRSVLLPSRRMTR